jgi:hypothetical protein
LQSGLIFHADYVQLAPTLNRKSGKGEKTSGQWWQLIHRGTNKSTQQSWWITTQFFNQQIRIIAGMGTILVDKTQIAGDNSWDTYGTLDVLRIAAFLNREDAKLQENEI